MLGVNSYGYHEGYGTGIRVLTLNVPATTDDFMSVDRIAFKSSTFFYFLNRYATIHSVTDFALDGSIVF